MVETTEIALGELRFRADVAGPAGGPVVVLLHGFPHSRYSWRHQLPALAAAGFRAVAFDQRGYSPKARPGAVADYAVDKLLGDAIGIAGSQGGERFHVVGHDWGGQLAWLLAANHGERIRTLNVLSRPHPAAFARAMAGDPRQSERSRHHRAFQAPDMADRLLADDARHLRRVLGEENIDALIGLEDAPGRPPARHAMSKADVDGYLETVGDRPALDAALNWYRAALLSGGIAAAGVPVVHRPTLYLWGDRDFSVGPEAAMGTADFVDAPFTFHRFEGAGHFLADEVPDGVTRHLLAHLERHRDA